AKSVNTKSQESTAEKSIIPSTGVSNIREDTVITTEQLTAAKESVSTRKPYDHYDFS
ncbi:unnamed protein product, partial [Heterobilharzia americana]